MNGYVKSGRSVLYAFFFLVAATSVHAQEIATSFDQLRVLVKPGDSVTVTDAAGSETKGKILSLSSSSLELSVGNTQRTLAESEVRRISQQRHADLGTGARWGFFVGAGLGALLGVAVAESYGDGDAGDAVVLGLLSAAAYGGLGAGVGVGVAALIPRPRVVYAGPSTSSSQLSVSPVLLAGRRGVAVSFGF